MDRIFALVGTLLGLTGVGLGAFGAHGLKTRVSAELLQVFETGVRYQMYHAFALFAVAWAASRWPGTSVTAAGWLILVGVTIFSGSLYILTLSGVRWWGAVTPIGGILMLAGWAALGWGILKAQ